MPGLTGTNGQPISSPCRRRCAPLVPKIVADPPDIACSLKAEPRNINGVVLISFPLACARESRSAAMSMPRGSPLSTAELVEAATGDPLGAAAFERHLRLRYLG